MQSTDLQVIKEIPGYKVILKAVLKSQIQYLVSFPYNRFKPPLNRNVCLLFIYVLVFIVSTRIFQTGFVSLLTCIVNTVLIVNTV